MVEKLTSATKKMIPFGIVILILTISIALIGYGKGWRVDVTNKSVKPTGLVSATSTPSGAQVYIDGKLKTATNNAFNIDPGWYTIRIVREGYLPWEKKLRVQGEVAIKIEALLFPANPSLSPLTTTGISKPTRSPDGEKVAYIVPSQSGTHSLLVLELSDRPLGINRDPQLVAILDLLLQSSDMALSWAPDSRQILVSAKGGARLYTLGKPDASADVTQTRTKLIADWTLEENARKNQKLAGFPQELINVASTSAHILSFSPDETKILYEATASATIPIIINPPRIASNPTPEIRDITSGKIYVYDTKEDKNFLVGEASKLRNTLPITPSLIWFPTSNHLLLSQNGKINIMEYDGTNRVTIYAGPYTDGFLTPWPSGSRLVILTNLNPGTSTLPNLYAVNLR